MRVLWMSLRLICATLSHGRMRTAGLSGLDAKPAGQNIHAGRFNSVCGECLTGKQTLVRLMLMQRQLDKCGFLAYVNR